MIGFYSYLCAALGFSILGLLLLSSWRTSAPGRLLVLVSVCSAAWAGAAMQLALTDRDTFGMYAILEVLRYVAWFVFLLRIYEPAAMRLIGNKFPLARVQYLFCGFALLLCLADLMAIPESGYLQSQGVIWARQMGHVFLAIIGLAMIEQIYRNVTAEYYQTLKYLFLGVGCIFAFDFYLYANALLFMEVDRELWEARGVINLVAVPLLALSAARNREWSTTIFVSRDIVLHTTTIIGSGMYLLVMAGAGFYLQEYGGDWGRILQLAFFTLAMVFLVYLLFSSQWRRQLRVFLGKNFYRNKYDYRREWLALTGALSSSYGHADGNQSAIMVLAQLVDAQAGMLWMDGEDKNYRNVSSWGCRAIDETEPHDGSLAKFLARYGYVINLLDIDYQDAAFSGLQLPEWLDQVKRPWLIVPLTGPDGLLGFVLLSRPLVVRRMNWEDHDLLKTAARQVAAHLAVIQANDALTQARQFEVFNRLSSYMVHDLKNIAAGLEMVSKNALRHRGNPEFISDALDSVSTAARDIRRLLDQLRSKRVVAGKDVVIDMNDLLAEVIRQRSNLQPAPELLSEEPDCRVTAERERMKNVLLHLVENAQQATTGNGIVTVTMRIENKACVVDIRDDGVGMDAGFIRDRLFRPFDTTKGNAGMGIGMYESREYIRQLGGEIQVNSEPGKGSLVSVRLPVCAIGINHPEGANSAPGKQDASS